jgi:protein-S-isoprenylcysteine O-methyltransferase Ste14
LEGSQLVQSGIYALIRHPLYTAVFSASTGWALLYASWPALIAALCLAPFFDAKASVEERALQAKFPEYAHYQSRVKRFIPWVY